MDNEHGYGDEQKSGYGDDEDEDENMERTSPQTSQAPPQDLQSQNQQSADSANQTGGNTTHVSSSRVEDGRHAAGKGRISGNEFCGIHPSSLGEPQKPGNKPEGKLSPILTRMSIS